MLVCMLWAGPANAQQGDTSICPALFSGSQGAAFKQDNPPRYSVPAQNNGDGTYTLAYGIISQRYMGPAPTARVDDCAFVDANGNSQARCRRDARSGVDSRRSVRTGVVHHDHP